MDNERRRAHYVVMRALAQGLITAAPACQACGAAPPLEMHHPHGHGPEQQLVVEWLCEGCHRQRHRRAPYRHHRPSWRMEIKQAILASGWSQREIAKRVGISPSMLSLYVRGRAKLSPQKEAKLRQILARWLG